MRGHPLKFFLYLSFLRLLQSRSLSGNGMQHSVAPILSPSFRGVFAKVAYNLA
jgi:hypothetical protein